jgi:hypothetical protein
MCVHTPVDADMDGFPAQTVGGSLCAGGTDCNDLDATVNPGVMEMCNGVDDNCNGMVDEGCAVPPDTCATAQEIVLTAGRGSARGRLDAFTANYNTVCGLSGARDAVYYVDVTALSDVRIDTIGSTTDTLLAVGAACGTAGFRMGCNDDIDDGRIRSSRIWVHRFGPTAAGVARRLYILVDGYSSTATGSYVVNVQVSTPAAPDSCSGPIDISGGGALVGFLGPAIAIGGPQGSCQGSGSAFLAEGIATLVGPTDGGASFDAYSNDFDPDVYLRRTPCATGAEVACVAGDGTGARGYTYHTRLATGVPAGNRHYLFIDGAGANDHYFVEYEP